MEELTQKWKNSVCICFALDNNYIPYLSVAIKSIIENSSDDNFYEIYILENDILNHNKSKILSLTKGNIYIKFININLYILNYGKNIFKSKLHITIETYYRFFVPRIFKNFEKILYLDPDILVLSDIAELYNKINDKMIYAVKDVGIIQFLFNENKNSKNNVPLYKDYLQNKLKLQNPYNYFNAGILLLNIQKLLEFDFEKKCIEKLKNTKNYIYMDQCILNSLLQNEVEFIDFSWNMQINNGKENYLENELPEDTYNDFIKAFDNPKIIHYCSHKKPWNNYNTITDTEKTNLWWKYASVSPFYNEIASTNILKKVCILENKLNELKNKRNIIDFIFSVQEDSRYKIITIFGIKINIKVK